MARAKTIQPQPHSIAIVHPDRVLSSELRDVGGSRSDLFNQQLLNGLASALPQRSAIFSRETQEAAYGAATVGQIEGKPQDVLEGMLLAQIQSAHAAADELHRLAWIEGQPFVIKAKYLGLADKAQRTMATLIEALDRHRGKGQQVVRVEHVTVNAGGQAIVGNVSTGGGGGAGNRGTTP